MQGRGQLKKEKRMIEHKIGKLAENNELNWWLEKEGESVVLKCANSKTGYFTFKVLSINGAGEGFLYMGLVPELGLKLHKHLGNALSLVTI